MIQTKKGGEENGDKEGSCEEGGDEDHCEEDVDEEEIKSDRQEGDTGVPPSRSEEMEKGGIPFLSSDDSGAGNDAEGRSIWLSAVEDMRDRTIS